MWIAADPCLVQVRQWRLATNKQMDRQTGGRQGSARKRAIDGAVREGGRVCTVQYSRMMSREREIIDVTQKEP